MKKLEAMIYTLGMCFGKSDGKDHIITVYLDEIDKDFKHYGVSISKSGGTRYFHLYDETMDDSPIQSVMSITVDCGLDVHHMACLMLTAYEMHVKLHKKE